VLLDEPLSNLDAKLRLEMRAEIRRIHDRSPRTFVYVTHDQKEALSMADRIAVMNAGRIVQLGTPEEVYTAPRSLFCAKFLGNANELAGTLRSVDGGLATVQTPAGALAARVGPEGLGVGSAAVIAVRPELLRPAAPGENNAFDARVLSRMYLGETVQYQLDAGGIELSATPPAGSLASARPGDVVRIAFDPLAAIAFPA
jgi:ABC-type Fe3+/spermidine/putrescine transport system ATPase subunit